MVAAVAAAAAATFLLLPVPVLRVTHVETGSILWRVPVAAGAYVDLNYTNSLFNAPTTERFVVTGGLLRLIEISSTKQAVLEYLALEPPYEERDGRFVSRRRGPLFNDITVRIGQTGQQRLVAGGREIPLYEVGTGQAVRVAVARAPRFIALMQRSR
ncbi:MAG: hypothetical protein QN178_12675 [Armatimonadota bacterium]|nr:hypothetical protein [Armatimonadota bacterium]